MIVKTLDKSQVILLRDIDRTETVKAMYSCIGGELVRERRVVEVPPWTPEQCDRHIAWQNMEMDKGGALLGAFEADELAGILVLGNRPVGGDPKTAQLVFLHVTAKHRRKGAGTMLVREARKLAKMRGKKRFYISATPSESAVCFYTSQGAHPAEKPDPGLYAKEPEDIHMVLEL
ncbi:MAG: GNAT family N-acetyltransferase [Euryarchaeota archaeon]|nr:GNAT family N-acetyltransferase [Euryarchaeota archaeon]